jgi:hypothetical protein
MTASKTHWHVTGRLEAYEGELCKLCQNRISMYEWLNFYIRPSDMNKIGDTLIHSGENKVLVRAFKMSEVEFIVIGGLAVAWYCSDRQADDMDLLVNPTPENSARISQALNGLGLSGYSVASFTQPGLQVRLKHTYYAELLTPQKEGLTYSEVDKDAVDAKLFSIPIRLALCGPIGATGADASANVPRLRLLLDLAKPQVHAAPSAPVASAANMSVCND